jgi:hypothetical protein
MKKEQEILKFAVCIKQYYTGYIDLVRKTIEYMKLGQIGEVKSRDHLSILGTVMATDVQPSHLKFFNTLEEAEVFSAEVKEAVKTLEDTLGIILTI